MRRSRWTEEQGRRVAYLRIARGILTREGLALLVGESTGKVYRWEAARCRPDDDQLARLARALRVPPSSLVA